MPQEQILIVDDSVQFARSLTKYMLKPLNYGAMYAKNGVKGLEMATKYQPDLIMLDMHMPGMTGLEMLDALRRTSCTAPVIFMTAEGSETIAVKAFRLGVRNYLVKPFSSETLQKAIDGALRETRLAREKETLARELIVSETIRETVVTLSHYLNNYLLVLSGNLFLINEDLEHNASDLLELVAGCQNNVTKIEALLNVMQQVTDVKKSTYHDRVTMIDVEAALQQAYHRLQQNEAD